jgi:glycosyltransferase involved in cell wall biosynthesis
VADLSIAGSTAVRRILLIEANEDHTVGGSHQVLFDLVRSLDRRRYEPVVLFYQDNPFVHRLRPHARVIVYESERADEIRRMLTGGSMLKVAALARAIRRRARLLRELRIDIVHINNSPRVGKDDWLPAARLAGVPCIATAAGDAEGERGPLQRWLFRSFDHVLPVSDYIHEAMARAGIDPRRMTKVSPGIDLAALRDKVRRTPAQVRAELGVQTDTVLIVMAGNIRPWKGQHVVLEALSALDMASRQRLHVVFIGAAGPETAGYEATLHATARSHGLDGIVSFLGGRSDIADFFNAADLALHASVIPEPFGLVVVEALALGTPVIAANAGGPAEIITDDCGVTYDSGRPDELARILAGLVHDDARRARLEIGARRRAAEFSVAMNVEGVEAAYAHCCRQQPRRFRRIPHRHAVPA